MDVVSEVAFDFKNVNIKPKTAAAFLIVALAIDLSGCKPKEKEQVIANNVVESEQALITGQIFIVTKGRDNVVLGDEKVALLDATETRTYFNSKFLEWSNKLVAAQAEVDQATTNYDALYKADLDKFAAAKKYHENIMQTVPTDSQAWNDAFDWDQKVETQISDMLKLKHSSDARKQLDDAAEKQANLWDEINWPSPDYFESSIDTTTTDSEGRFKFVVPKSRVDLDMTLFSKAERLVGDEKENYWWMVNVNLNGKKTAEYILSNDNKDSSGAWGWLNDAPKKWMIDYQVKMEADQKNRDYNDWRDKLDEKDNSNP